MTYSLADVVKATGVPRTTLLDWLSAGLVGCSYVDGSREFNVDQLRWVEAVSDLQGRGVSLKHMASRRQRDGSSLAFLIELASACEVAAGVLAQSMSEAPDRV